MFNGTTDIYQYAREVRAAETSETAVPLLTPISATVKILVDVWDFDWVSSSDFIAQFEGILVMDTITQKPSPISLFRKDIIFKNDVSMKAYARADCPGQKTCSIVCRPREGVNTCDKNGNFICQRGFLGPTCDRVDYCVTNNCADYATCESLQDGYRCVCRGNEGSACLKSNDPCMAGSLCGPHGQCRADAPEYRCVCDAGWDGRLCDHEVTPCKSAALELDLPSVCLNEGICLDIGDNTFYCQCPRPWTGLRCDVLDVCAYDNCTGHGACVFQNSSRNNFYCKCDSGWVGASCSYRISAPCQIASQKLQTSVSMVCLHGGICVDNPNRVDFNCECPIGWFGKQCEIPFTQTLHFIIPMTVLPLLILLIVAINYRRLLRRNLIGKIQPVTYATPQTYGYSDDSEISPYAVYVPTDPINPASRIYSSILYPKSVGNQEKVSLNCPNFDTHASSWKESYKEVTPALPLKIPLCEKASWDSTDANIYSSGPD